MSEEEDKVIATSPRRVSVLRSLTLSIWLGGHGSRLNMETRDNTLRFPVFHGTGRDDAKKHWFTCEAIWSMKRIADEASKIAQSETTFRDKALRWYMNYKGTASVGKTRSLTKIKRDVLKEFQKPKLESQFIIEIKEIK